MASELKSDRAAWLQGPSAHCEPLPALSPHPWRLALLGAPGVGKGTQADLLNKHLRACHLSTGDIFRAESTNDQRRSRAYRGRQIRASCSRNHLAFERRPDLAQCKSVFHATERPPKVAGVCDRCGGKLFEREDDRPESIKARIVAYEQSTAPLIEFYQNLGLLLPIAARGTPEEICQRTLAMLDSWRLQRPS
jgi:adenylate kinase family enzyme